MWPISPEGFSTHFKDLMSSFKELAWQCFVELAKDGRTEGSDEKVPLINQENLSAVEEFVGRKSSLSLIHYYKTPDSPSTKELEEDGEDKFCVCELHKVLHPFAFKSHQLTFSSNRILAC